MRLLLSFILALFALPSFASVCDLDGNGSVDTADLTILRSRVGQTVPAGSVGDANGDGRITINDVAACSAQCTNARCSPSQPAKLALSADVCDVNDDGVIDRTDIAAVRALLGTTVTPGAKGDANGDGAISTFDVRQCTLRCTNANCAPSSAKSAASAAKAADPRTLVVAQPCDVNNDGAINTLDLLAIRSMIGFVVTPGAAGDANNDGVISMADYRACTLRCTNAGCAV